MSVVFEQTIFVLPNVGGRLRLCSSTTGCFLLITENELKVRVCNGVISRVCKLKLADATLFAKFSQQ